MSYLNSKQTTNMGHGKSNNVDKIPTFSPQLQNTEEIGFQSLSNEAVCFAGLTGVETVDAPLNELSHFPSSHLGDMSLKGIDWMIHGSQLDSYQNFMVHPHVMNGTGYVPSQYSTLENIASNTGGLQMGMQGAKVYNSKPQSIGNFMSCGSRAPLLCGAQDGREMGSNNNLVDCVVQSDYPETLDGSFLTLGVGVNTESRSKANALSRDFIGKIDGAIKMQLNPSHVQSGYESSFSPDFRMAVALSDNQTYAGGFSSIEENAVGLSSLKHNLDGLHSIVQNAGESSNVSAFAGTVQNAGESSNVSAFAGPVQNVDSCSLSEYHLGVSDSTSSNFSLSTSQMLPMPQSHVSHPLLTPDDQKFCTGFANIDPFHGLSGVSPNIVHISSQSGLPPNQSFLGLPGGSPIVHGSSQFGLPPNEGFHSLCCESQIVHSSRQSGLPVQAQHRMAPWPSLSSYMTSKYATLASDQLQKCNMGSIPCFQWGTSVASPVLGNIESTSNQYQSAVWQHYPAHHGGANQTVENAPFSKRIEDQLFACDGGASQVSTTIPFSKNSGNKLSASDGTAAEVVSITPSFKNIGVQPSSTGQVISFSRESGPANLLAGPSRKRKAAQSPPATPQVQIKKTRSAKPSIRSSTLYRARDAPFVSPLPPVVSQGAPVPSLTQSTSTVPPVKLTARPLPPLAYKGPSLPSLSQVTPAYAPLTRTAPVPPSARMSHPPRIKWQDPELLQLSGHNCLLCKRDLSYAPEGPVFQPALPPPVAVLSCGHCFHDLCLERITPKDEADNPPCIPCVISES
ncbi:PREDICTED: uncharacterized protein LOC18595483 isoform X3 [Theobroma cacao]|uniref:Uncharacterized protein LOC18595483 isoform X3 n=1 Tax=Theobroma cacao TaxID=3641 RepID=A0AB32WJ73_THECC|nr:PREDICTED: uncharacterized protein LOC18595483 isoform X3 [Theobroma cacao]